MADPARRARLAAGSAIVVTLQLGAGLAADARIGPEVIRYLSAGR